MDSSSMQLLVSHNLNYHTTFYWRTRTMAKCQLASTLGRSSTSRRSRSSLCVRVQIPGLLVSLAEAMTLQWRFWQRGGALTKWSRSVDLQAYPTQQLLFATTFFHVFPPLSIIPKVPKWQKLIKYELFQSEKVLPWGPNLLMLSSVQHHSGVLHKRRHGLDCQRLVQSATKDWSHCLSARKSPACSGEQARTKSNCFPSQYLRLAEKSHTESVQNKQVSETCLNRSLQRTQLMTSNYPNSRRLQCPGGTHRRRVLGWPSHPQVKLLTQVNINKNA